MLEDGDTINITEEKSHKTERGWSVRETHKRKLIIKTNMINPSRVCFPKETDSEAVSWYQR